MFRHKYFRAHAINTSHVAELKRLEIRKITKRWKATTVMDIAQTEGYYIRKPQLHALHHPAGELTAHETIYLKDFKVFRWHENFKKCFDACGITTWT